MVTHALATTTPAQDRHHRRALGPALHYPLQHYSATRKQSVRQNPLVQRNSAEHGFVVFTNLYGSFIFTLTLPESESAECHWGGGGGGGIV